MPYAPGVVDRRGEIMGQGILSALQSFSSGITAFKSKQDETKQLEGQNKALETLIAPAGDTAGLPPELVDQLLAKNPDETPRTRNARLTTALQGIMTQQQLRAEQQKQKLQQMQIDAASHDTAAAAAAAAPTLPDPAAVSAAFNAGTPIPTAQAPDYSNAVLKYLSAGGKNPSTLNALNEMARTKMITTEREKAANLRAGSAEDKLANAAGNFDTIDAAATKALELQKKGIKGVHIVSKPKGTYDIEVKPPTEYAPDAAGKVQALMDQAQEELAAAQDAGDGPGIAAAQQKILNFQARMKKVNSTNTGLLGLVAGPAGVGGGSMVDQVNAGGAAPATNTALAGAGPLGKPAVAAPPVAAIQMLKQHPELAGQFDLKYGQGSAARLLATP